MMRLTRVSIEGQSLSNSRNVSFTLKRFCRPPIACVRTSESDPSSTNGSFGSSSCGSSPERSENSCVRPPVSTAFESSAVIVQRVLLWRFAAGSPPASAVGGALNLVEVKSPRYGELIQNLRLSKG